MAQLYNQALKLAHSGNLAEAIKVCDQCIKGTPNMLDAYRLKCEALYHDHKYKAAEDAYADLIRRFPSSQCGYCGRGFMLTLLGDAGEVERLYQQALEHNQRNYRTYFCRGYTFATNNQYGQAQKMYKKAVVKNPLEDPVVYICAAEALFALKQLDNARNSLKYARKAAFQQQKSNVLYTFYLETIKSLLKQYEEKVDTLEQSLKNNQITLAKKNELELELTKSLARSVILNDPGIFTEYCAKVFAPSEGSNRQIVMTEQQIAQKGAVPWCDCPACTIF